MKNLAFAAAVMLMNTRAFMSDIVETVSVGGVRVNKSDYEADQAKPAEDRQYGSLDSATKQAASPQSTGDTPQPLPPGVSIPPAPAAPEYVAPNEPPAPVASTGAVTPTVPTPGQLLTLKEGKPGKERYFIVDATGTKVEREGIDPKGYDTEKDAWDAIIAATPH